MDLMDHDDIIMEMIEDKRFKRNNIVITYAFCIISSKEIDFKKINYAIINRWSIPGLEYIKKKAWKKIEEIEDL